MLGVGLVALLFDFEPGAAIVADRVLEELDLLVDATGERVEPDVLAVVPEMSGTLEVDQVLA